MDDPTKDTIPRSAVEYCLRKETVSTNPEKYKTHEKFIDYMNDPDISEFGHWMHSNGFNCALTAISVDLKKIPSVTPSAQPGWVSVTKRLPKANETDENGRHKAYLVQQIGWKMHTARYDGNYWILWDGWKVLNNIVAWMPLPERWRGDGK